jgi:hypothetical protein
LVVFEVDRVGGGGGLTAAGAACRAACLAHACTRAGARFAQCLGTGRGMQQDAREPPIGPRPRTSTPVMTRQTEIAPSSMAKTAHMSVRPRPDWEMSGPLLHSDRSVNHWRKGGGGGVNGLGGGAQLSCQPGREGGPASPSIQASARASHHPWAICAPLAQAKCPGGRACMRTPPQACVLHPMHAYCTPCMRVLLPMHAYCTPCMRTAPHACACCHLAVQLRHYPASLQLQNGLGQRAGQRAVGRKSKHCKRVGRLRILLQPCGRAKKMFGTGPWLVRYSAPSLFGAFTAKAVPAGLCCVHKLSKNRKTASRRAPLCREPKVSDAIPMSQGRSWVNPVTVPESAVGVFAGGLWTWWCVLRSGPAMEGCNNCQCTDFSAPSTRATISPDRSAARAVSWSLKGLRVVGQWGVRGVWLRLALCSPGALAAQREAPRSIGRFCSAHRLRVVPNALRGARRREGRRRSRQASPAALREGASVRRGAAPPASAAVRMPPKGPGLFRCT